MITVSIMAAIAVFLLTSLLYAVTYVLVTTADILYKLYKRQLTDVG